MTRTPAPAVDVIVTGHDYGRWLGEALASVFAQTRRDYTLTVVDDGSTDDTSRVADRCLRRAPEGVACALLHTRDVGPARARDTAIRRGHAPYVLFLDADDLLAPTALERHVAELARHPKAGFSCSDRQAFGDLTRTYRETAFDLETLKRHNFAGGGVLIRRRAYERVGGFRRDNWGYGEDWDLWLAMAEAGFTWRHVAEPLFRYRHHMSTSLSFFTTRFHAAYMALLYVHHPTLYTADQVRRARAVLRAMPRGWHRRAPYRTVEDCRTGLAANPDNPHLLFLLAMAHVQRGEFKAATRHLTVLDRQHPRDAQARFALSVLRSIQTRETVRLGHQSMSIQEALCRLLQLHGHGIQVDIPARIARAAARIRPRTLYVDTILLRFWEGRVERLRREVAHRLLGDPAVFDAATRGAHQAELQFLHNVASAHQARGAHEDAVALFERLLTALQQAGERTPESDYEIGACHYHLGEMAFEAGSWREARRRFGLCLVYTPGHVRATQYLARIDGLIGDRSHAMGADG